MRSTEKLRRIVMSICVAALGIALLKVVPMAIWGPAIEFDASFHVTVTLLGLYILWFFIDQNPRWRVPFFLLASVVTLVVAIQRLLIDAHSDIGILLGIAVGMIAIGAAEWQDIKHTFSF